MNIAISSEEDCIESAQQLANSSGIPLVQANIPSPSFLLHLNASHLELHFTEDTSLKPLYIDFLSGKARHRRLYGGGKGQQLAKAIGLNKYKNPTVLDTTAGLGRDGFVLATLGCQMTMIERALPVYLLLKDALNRVENSEDEAVKAITRNMKLIHSSSMDFMEKMDKGEYPDVVYIDPMFPAREKSAKVKKDMALFHHLVGKDEDSEKLLELALTKAQKRIAVKRPKLAAPLCKKPNFQITGKSTRYDIYLPESH